MKRHLSKLTLVLFAFATSARAAFDPQVYETLREALVLTDTSEKITQVALPAGGTRSFRRSVEQNKFVETTAALVASSPDAQARSDRFWQVYSQIIAAHNRVPGLKPQHISKTIRAALVVSEDASKTASFLEHFPRLAQETFERYPIDEYQSMLQVVVSQVPQTARAASLASREKPLSNIPLTQHIGVSYQQN